MVHYEASILACEDAFGVKPPPNARIIRNLMAGAWHMGDHIMHFYHLHGMDWVDVVSALSANPRKAVDLAKATTLTLIIVPRPITRPSRNG